MIDLSNSFTTIVKIFDFIFLGLFIFYSLLTVRQVSIMNHSVLTRGALWLNLLALLQLGLGVVVLIVIWVGI